MFRLVLLNLLLNNNKSQLLVCESFLGFDKGRSQDQRLSGYSRVAGDAPWLWNVSFGGVWTDLQVPLAPPTSRQSHRAPPHPPPPPPGNASSIIPLPAASNTALPSTRNIIATSPQHHPSASSRSETHQRQSVSENHLRKSLRRRIKFG